MEGFKPTSNEANVDPLEVIRDASKTVEINKAVKELYPEKEIKDLYNQFDKIDTQNPNADWNEMLPKLQQEVSVLLDQFAEKVIATNRPEAIFAAYNRTEDVGHVEAEQGVVSYISQSDQERFKELYRTHALQAISSKLEGLSEEEQNDALEKYAKTDSNHLLSAATEWYQWVDEVKPLLNSSQA